MAQSTSLSPLGQLVSLAYAGTDMPVHLVCTSPHQTLVKWTLDYPHFQRLLRERANRKEVIRLLDTFRRVRVQHEDTDMRTLEGGTKALVDVISVLGQGLALSAPDQPLRPTLQCAA